MSVIRSIHLHCLWPLRALLATLAAVSVLGHAAELDLAQVEKALNLISKFADSMCPAPAAKGSSFNAEGSLAAKAEVGKLVKKLGELKLEGATKLQSTEYQGLLQNDLLEALKNSSTCKQNLYNDIKDRVLPAKDKALEPKSVSTAPRSAAPNAGDMIIGAWKEYMHDPEKNKWEYIGTYDVAKNKSGFIMSAREQREPPDVSPSIGLFDVQSDGASWSFNSNWGSGLVGNFSLHRVSQTIYEGSVNVGGKEIASTRWVRIQ